MCKCHFFFEVCRESMSINLVNDADDAEEGKEGNWGQGEGAKG